MHAERDHLVRVVFPELRERCARRRLHLVEVDLRWGVTEEEAQTGKVLEICLEEIDRSRPWFICLLGNRYGWAPPRYETPDERSFDWLKEVEAGQSVTSLEILHGALWDRGRAANAF